MGVDLIGGHEPLRQLCFENFVCQNKRIWTLRGCALGTPPLDPPMVIKGSLGLLIKNSDPSRI